MASTKRPHERGPSLSLRPHKSARVVQGDTADVSSEDERMSMDGDASVGARANGHTTTLWDSLQLISTCDPLIVPPLQFLGRPVRPLTVFDVSGITAWPDSLGAIKNQFRYNLTPQDGPTLPVDVVNLTAWRRMSRQGQAASPPARAPYLHLGFSVWLNIDVFVFFPHLGLDACVNQDPGRIQEAILEAWTDHCLLPAMYTGDPRSPSSWRLSKANQTSTLWFDASVAEYPTYKIFRGDEMQQIWEKVVTNAQGSDVFRDAFLVMHMSKRQSGVFTGSNPDAVFRDFERAWMQEIDLRFIDLGTDNLKISLSCDVVV